jgi:hypothetical protein
MVRKENSKMWAYTPNGILLNPMYGTSSLGDGYHLKEWVKQINSVTRT